MLFLDDSLQNWADIVYQEIIADDTEYFWPKASDHYIFEQAYMKFVNRNLNYFDFKNMIVTALLEKQEFHPNFVRTLEFCEFVREKFNNKELPFGRMCIWNIPPKKRLLPHVDNFVYHSLITRYIFLVSDHKEEEITIRINNEKVLYQKGKLFLFYPAVELHEFINDSDIPFYFLGFDVWDKEKLNRMSKNVDLQQVLQNPSRYNSFGGPKTNCKYISKH